MTTPSHRRRRTGALLLGASMLLVPLTASISYAQDEVADAPLPPEPPAAPLAPRAIDAPLAPVEPGAPGAPEAPLPPEAPHALHHGGTYVVEHGHGPVSGERVVIIREERDGKASGHPVVSRKYRVVSRGEDGKFDAKALERQMEALHDRLGNLEHLRTVMTPEEIARITSESRHAARVAVATAPHAPAVLMSCDGKGEVSDTTTSEGRRVIRICQQRAMAPAIDGLRSARAQIARQREMSAETREEVLDRLDREIERLEAAK